MLVSSHKFTRTLCQSIVKSSKIINYVRHVTSSATLLQNSEFSQNIFDRNVKRLQKERSAQRPDVALFDYIKDEVGFRLSDRIFDIKREFKVAADIGLINFSLALNLRLYR